MDDLLGEDWQAPSKPPTSAPTNTLNAKTFASNYSSFRSSPAPPLSGALSPQNISRPPSSVNGSAKAPAGDSFGNLLSLKPQKQASNISIQERQRQIAEEKRRKQEEQSSLWNNLGSGRGTPEIRGRSPAAPAPAANEDEDDILAAFNKAAPVNKASHFPPPSSDPTSRGSTPALPPAPQSFDVHDESDDDPFGLGDLSQKRNDANSSRSARQTISVDDEDDNLLGDLGKPMVRRAVPQAPPEPEPVPVHGNDAFAEPRELALTSPPGDSALAELIDMGFAADTAQIALAENGGDVQHAVGWLLRQAHQESRAKAQGEANEGRRHPDRSTSPPRRHQEDEAQPSWARQERHNNVPAHRHDARSPAIRDTSQAANDFGSKFLKGANSLWKASQKQMSKTMAEFQQDRDPAQPKWMLDAERSSSRPRQGAASQNVTDEAAMLDAPRDRPVKPPRHAEQQTFDRRPVEPLPHRPSPQPRFMQHPPPAQDKGPATKLSRQDVEEQSAQAYVSPARRKRVTPKPEPQPEPEVDLFSPDSVTTPSLGPSRVASRPPSSRPSPAPSRPAVPPREVPNVSFSALSTSAAHRKRGGDAFKRGDYASAHESYTAALSPLPPTHPITIIVLTNRALTALKTGDAKTAVADASQALEIIGPGLGANETIDLGGDEAPKPMRDFHGKALTRKAEALEHLEKWTDAAAAWRQAIEAGVGGTVALRGRDRCEKAASPPKPGVSTTAAAAPRSQARAALANPKTPVPTRTGATAAAPPPKGLGNSLHRPTLTSATEAEAVRRLRESNAAAEKADDERFQLADQVDARLATWKGGKADNLRALLQSLDAVLWADAGWKKVGMSDLVMPNKVKIVYMKAIAKVHPDKISQDATTEQRMVSAAVFSTLNEAWDKFKKDNNL